THTFRVVQVATGMETVVPLNWKAVASVRLMPDGKSVFLMHGESAGSPSPDKRGLFSLEQQQIVKPFQDLPKEVQYIFPLKGAEVAQNGKVAAVEMANQVAFWNTDTGQVMGLISYPKADSEGDSKGKAVFSPDGQYYVLPYSSGSLYV